MNSDLAVEVSGLRKAFGEVVAVESVCLEVAPGEIVGLVGPDGAGKTTTMRMLCGILLPDAGSIRVAGHDAVRDPEGVKARIGYVPQRFSLHRDLTVNENIQYFADLYSVPRRIWQPRRQELLEITQMAPFGNRLAGQLSGGMRQKLSLLCSLIHRPEVLLLDEPTTGVDPLSRRDFWKILYDLPRQGVTMLISTPYMDEAARCTRVGFLHQGRVLREDTPQHLRESVESRIFEVHCPGQRECREVLKGHPGVEGVEVFGEHLHVALRPGADPETIWEDLARAGVTEVGPEEVPASLEDVFVAMAAGGEVESRKSKAESADGRGGDTGETPVPPGGGFSGSSCGGQ
jgi:ABC-2 type transport system ATP-binding protein